MPRMSPLGPRLRGAESADAIRFQPYLPKRKAPTPQGGVGALLVSIAS